VGDAHHACFCTGDSCTGLQHAALWQAGPLVERAVGSARMARCTCVRACGNLLSVASMLKRTGAHRRRSGGSWSRRSHPDATLEQVPAGPDTRYIAPSARTDGALDERPACHSASMLKPGARVPCKKHAVDERLHVSRWWPADSWRRGGAAGSCRSPQRGPGAQTPAACTTNTATLIARSRPRDRRLVEPPGGTKPPSSPGPTAMGRGGSRAIHGRYRAPRASAN